MQVAPEDTESGQGQTTRSINLISYKTESLNQQVTVDDNSFALIMAYLSCVKSVTPKANIAAYMTSYSNYRYLTRGQKDAIEAAAMYYPPESVKAFFLVGDRAIQGEQRNVFLHGTYTVESMSQVLQTKAERIVMQLQIETQTVFNEPFMMHTAEWLSEMYSQPLYTIQTTKNLCNIL